MLPRDQTKYLRLSTIQDTSLISHCSNMHNRSVIITDTLKVYEIIDNQNTNHFETKIIIFDSQTMKMIKFFILKMLTSFMKKISSSH